MTEIELTDGELLVLEQILDAQLEGLRLAPTETKQNRDLLLVSNVVRSIRNKTRDAIRRSK